MNPILLGELIGTCILVYLGCSTVAGVLLTNSKSFASGWLVITLGWSLGAMIAIYVAGPLSGAHLNPAVTLALAVIGKIPADSVLYYVSGQFFGALLGAVLCYLHFLPHWSVTTDANLKLGVFCTAPAIRNTFANFLAEFLATAILMIGLLAIGSTSFADGLNPLIIALLITCIGLSLGGTTGWAINPARDLGPRMVHFLLPIPGKRDSDWNYAWIPVLAPITGAIVGALFYNVAFS